MDTVGIVAIISVIGSLLAIVIALKKAPHETKEIDSHTENQDADTASKYQDIADRAAVRALGLEVRVNELECEVAKLKDENRRQHSENADLRDWAERLTHQVQSLGGDPMKLRVKVDRQ